MLELTNVRYFSPDEKRFLSAKSIVIEDGLVKTISQNSDQSNVNTIDCSEKFVIPGLIDAHIHFFQSGGLFTRPDGLDLRHIKSYEYEFEEIKASIPVLFKRYLACGITGVVDCGGPFWNFNVLKDSKAMIAPDVAVAGPLVSTVPREKLDLGDPPIIQGKTEEHARELVRRCVEKNPAFVKMWFIFRPEFFEDDSTIMKAAIDETHRLGLKAAVHATELETAKRAVSFGADILVHSVFDEDIDQEFIDMVVKRKVLYIPTLMVRLGYRDVYRTRIELPEFEAKWGDPDVIKSWRTLMVLDDSLVPEPYRTLKEEYDLPPPDLLTTASINLRRLAKAGAIICAGTDAGNVGTLHGPALHRELELMVQAGMSAEDVLVAATKNNAEILGVKGTITEGTPARMVILNSNPLQNIQKTTDIAFVIHGSNIYQPNDLVKPTSITSVVDQQLQAYNARDIDAFLECYHPRVEIYDLTTSKLRMRGLAELRKRYSRLFEKSPELKATITNRISFGNMVIDHEHVTGFMGNQTVQAIAYYEVKTNLITRVWFSR